MIERPVEIFGKKKRHPRRRKLLISLLAVLAFIALFADIIATDLPWYARFNHKTHFPAFAALANENAGDTIRSASGEGKFTAYKFMEWKAMPLESVLWAPVPYSPQRSDKENRNYVGPFDEQNCPDTDGGIRPCPTRFRHWMGTNKLGIDVLAAIIHGLRTSLLIGLVAVGVAAVLGTLLGGLAGYYGDSGWLLSRGALLARWLGVLFGIWYAFGLRGYAFAEAGERSVGAILLEAAWSLVIFGFVFILFVGLGRVLGLLPGLRRQVNVPVDGYVSRLIEVLDSLPRLLLIISLAALFQVKSVMLVMLVIGLTSWTGIARLMRAEFLKQRSFNYVEAAHALGMPDRRIIFRHILPNTLAPLLVTLTFGMAGALITESSLSFLGVGLPPEAISWGSLISESRDRLDAWWLIVFPGLAIFSMMMIYHLLGDSVGRKKS